MASGGVNLELQLTDTYPLLMDHNALASKHEAVVSVMPDTSRSMGDYKSCDSMGMPSSPRGNVMVVIDQPNILATPITGQANAGLPDSNPLARSVSTSSRSQLIPAARSSGRSRSSGGNTAHGSQQRTSALNSGLWLSIDMAITVAQIIASIIVLSLSRNENPRAPLALWIIGYAAGCLAMLPLLCWRYRHHHARQQEHDVMASSASSTSTPGMLPLHTSQQGAELDNSLTPAGESVVQNRGDARTAVLMERFKITLDCFFAVWFVIGNVWIFGGHTSSHDAPNLYRLCIVFLAFSCISYAMPFVICATVCCCLPCIITLLSYREEHTQVKGAAPEIIAGLPIYKFKTKEPKDKACKDGNDSDCESRGEGGFFAPGTDKERLVSGEDAVCCICLGQYKDGVDLKELQCTHFFHAECVDKWLKINATCPLCKHELSGSDGDDQHEESVT
eukprot:c8341_g1_i1 orf=507-1850(-)